MSNNSPEDGVTLVLGTGLVKCAAALGVVRVLRREHIPIREIITSSAGAIFGAVISYDIPIAQTQQFVTEIADFYRNASLSTYRRLQLLFPRIFGFDETFGLADNTKFVALFQRLLRDKTLQDGAVPLSVVATNFANGERVLIEHGPAWQAICASCSPLGLLPPLKINGQLLLDGAVSEPLPLSIAVERQAKVIIALGFENPYLDQVRSLPNYTNQSRNVSVNHLLKAQIALTNLASESEIIPIIPKFGMIFGQTDAQKIPLIIDKGAETSEPVINYIKTLLNR